MVVSAGASPLLDQINTWALDQPQADSRLTGLDHSLQVIMEILQRRLGQVDNLRQVQAIAEA